MLKVVKQLFLSSALLALSMGNAFADEALKPFVLGYKTSGDIQAVNYFVAQKYVEALQTIGTAPNQKLIFMPLDASGVIGAIGGVAELAKAAGVDDAWMVEDGYVTEGTSNNAYIVKGGTIITRHLGNEILHGITRAAVLRFARDAQMQVEERSFTIAEAQEADEAFITSASTAAGYFPASTARSTAACPGSGRPTSRS